MVIDCIVSEAAQGPVCRGLQSICGQYRQSQLTARLINRQQIHINLQPAAALYMCEELHQQLWDEVRSEVRHFISKTPFSLSLKTSRHGQTQRKLDVRRSVEKTLMYATV